jgi:nucleoid-associated protein YgaU
MKETYEANYGYFSKLLNKPFDTVEALIAAEKAEIEARNEKLKKSEDKKADAKKVEDAFKAVNAAKKTYDEEVLESQKACAKIIADAKAAYAQAVEVARKKVDAAEAKYAEALKEFTAKHPEGYHMTFRDGDTVTSISHAAYDHMVHDFYNSFLKLFE